MLLATAILVSSLFSQVPCTPGIDNTIVCDCKQGKASACEVLAETEPKLWEQIQKAIKLAGVGASRIKGNTDVGTGDPNDDDPEECKGQLHHIISKRIHVALQEHQVLKGLYKHRDPRFVSRAKDMKAHCGYFGWHQALDNEIASWIRTNINASKAEFEAYLHEVYRRAELLARFPNGF